MTLATLEEIGALVAHLRTTAVALDVAREQYDVATKAERDADVRMRAAQEEFNNARGALLSAAIPTKEDTWQSELQRARR